MMSDLNGISRLQEEQEKTLKNCESMIEKWEKFKEDYEAVDKLLNDLPKKTTHEIMVPVGPLAFMPGKLIHTNEIMVLLGDNWFAERSATQAVEIAKRRLKSVEEYLGNLRKEHENILSHMALTTDVFNTKSPNDFQEIKEELTDKDKQRQDNKSRRVAHFKATKHSVKKVDLQNTSSNSQTKSKDDENLFARLEELERQERKNNELENNQYFADSTACSTISKDKSTLAETMCTHETLRAESKIPACSDSVRTCGSQERAQHPSMLKEHSSLLAENWSFVPQQENTRATNTCTTQSEQNDTSRDSETKHSVKKVKWKENIDSTACSTISEDESTLTQTMCTHETLRAESKIPASSGSVRTCGSIESDQHPSMFEEHGSLLAESWSFVPQQENTRATNACTTQSEQNDRSRDSDTKHSVKKVKWKENVVEERGEDKVAYPREANATIRFTHSSGTVALKRNEERNIATPADILTDYLNRKDATATSKDEHVQKDEQILKSEIPGLKKAPISTQRQDNTKEKETTPHSQAFANVVVEHENISSESASIEKDKEQKTEPRKISKFKASRMKNN